MKENDEKEPKFPIVPAILGFIAFIAIIEGMAFLVRSSSNSSTANSITKKLTWPVTGLKKTSSIDQFDELSRWRKALHKNGIHTIWDLIIYIWRNEDIDSLSELPEIGEFGVERIKLFLLRHGTALWFSKEYF